MFKFKLSILKLVLIALTILCVPYRSYAYLDPGTGSYIFQLIIAAIIGGLFMIKLYWKKIRIFFKNIFCKGKND